MPKEERCLLPLKSLALAIFDFKKSDLRKTDSEGIKKNNPPVNIVAEYQKMQDACLASEHDVLV